MVNLILPDTTNQMWREYSCFQWGLGAALKLGYVDRSMKTFTLLLFYDFKDIFCILYQVFFNSNWYFKKWIVI